MKKIKNTILSGAAVLCCLMFCGTWTEGLLNLFLTAVLFQISHSDRQSYTIPPKYPVIIFLLGWIKLMTAESLPAPAFLGMLSTALPLLLLYDISGGSSLGGGDVKLMAAAGFYLGGFRGLSALFFGSLFAAVSHRFGRKDHRAGEPVAFGPYLSAGIWLTAVFYEIF